MRLSTTAPPFRHDALMYSGREEFVEGCAAFIRQGLERDEPALVVVSSGKIDLLRGELGEAADRVAFADMEHVGANPGRIIPAWREFVDRHARYGGPMRGIGEPITADRDPAALAECHRHESLLNLAFADAEGFSLLCPYDTVSLDPGIVAEARCTHPWTIDGGVEHESPEYAGLEAVAAPFADPLPDPPAEAPALSFDATTLDSVRARIADVVRGSGLSEGRAADLLLAAHELATNSILHGGGRGVLRAWTADDMVVCEVRDAGRIEEPLAGRERPSVDQSGGFGLWLANQLCDLVQVRVLPDGGAVRLHMRLA